MFTSVRAINKAITEEIHRTGKSVRVRQVSVNGEYFTPISRAKSDKDGGLRVRLVATDQWVTCTWSDVVIQ